MKKLKKKFGFFLNYFVYKTIQSNLSEILELYYDISHLGLIFAEMNDFSVKMSVSAIFEAVGPIYGFLGGLGGSYMAKVRYIGKSMCSMGF